MSFCFLYNVVSENYSIQNPSWGGGAGVKGGRGGERGSTAGPKSRKGVYSWQSG